MNLLKLNKLREILHKIKDYDRVCSELQDYKQSKEDWIDTNTQIGELYNKEKRKCKDLENKFLTLQNTKYSYLGIPDISMKELEETFSLVDTYTLGRITDFIELDSLALVKNLADSMTQENKYEISIGLNAVLNRNNAWVKVLNKYKKSDKFVNRANGTIQEKKK